MNNHNTEYWNKDADKYRQLADLLRAVAQEHCQASIDEVTHLRWQDLMGLMTEVDSYIDDRIVPGINTEADIVEELESFDRFRGRYPHLAPEVLGEVRWRRLEQAAREVVGSFVTLAGATTYEEYVEYRTCEAVATAQMFSACATETVESDDAFKTKFMPTLESISIAACLLDSANDLKQDVQESKASIDPSWSNRRKLYQGAFFEGWPHIKLLRHTKIAGEIGRAAIAHIGRHVKNSKE